MTYLLPIPPFSKEVFIMIILFLFTTVQQIEQITERYTVYYFTDYRTELRGKALCSYPLL